MVVVALLAVLGAAGCTTPPASGWVAAGCYNSPSVDAPDVRFSGVADVAGNLTVSLDIATFSLSTDGTCSGVPLADPYRLSMVRAADETAAATKCVALGLNDGAGQAQLEYPTLPADAWICNPPATT